MHPVDFIMFLRSLTATQVYLNIVKKNFIENPVKSKQKKLYWNLGVLLILLESP
jgi:hypothetical protein